MARWNHAAWIVAAHPLVDGCVMTLGFSSEAKTARTGAVYRRFRIDAGGEPVAFGNAFVEDGRIAVRLDQPLAGVGRFDFATDDAGLAVAGSGRMKRASGWEPLTVLPPC